MMQWRSMVAAAALLSSVLTATTGLAATTQLVTTTAAGAPVGAKEVKISDDGRLVFFSTNKPNIVPGVSSPYFLLYAYDRQTGINELVSADINGTPIPECYIDGFRRVVSADGRYVTFYTSYLTQDPVSGTFIATATATANRRVYVKDRLTGEIICASRDGAGQITSGSNSSISADGRMVSFLKTYSAGASTWSEIYITNLTTGVVIPLTGDFNPGSWGYKSSSDHSLSENGRYLAFKSSAQLTAEPLSTGKSGIFVYDTVAGTFERVDTNATGSVTNQSGVVAADNSAYPTMSNDGRFVSYLVYKAGLDSNNNTTVTEQCFVADRTSKTFARSDLGYFHTVANRTIGGIFPVISPDGSYVHFKEYTGRKNNTTGNEIQDLFVFERQTGNIARVNLSTSGEGADGSFFDYAGISADNSLVVFNSVATNLVPGVTTPNAIYLRDTEGLGYPLSFTITKAEYETAGQILTVEATSSRGAFAGMELLNNGVMTWDAERSIWSYAGPVTGQPATITVGNIEGYKTVPVVAVTDTTPPVVVSSSPAANATGVAISAAIAINFSETIAKGLNFAAVTLAKGTTKSKIITSISGNTLTITPSSALAKNATYTVTIPTQAIKDPAGNQLAASYSFSFKTAGR